MTTALDIQLTINKRMRELGHGGKYHYEPVFVSDGGNAKQINAYNEYWFLVTESIDAAGDLKILSDISKFPTTPGAIYNSLRFANVQEFSGNIRITQNPSVKLEFFRVIPEHIQGKSKRI